MNSINNNLFQRPYANITSPALLASSPKKITEGQNTPPGLLKKIASVAAMAALILGLSLVVDSSAITPPPSTPAPPLPPVNFKATSAEAGAAQGMAITTLAFLAYSLLFKSEPKPPVPHSNIYQRGSVVSMGYGSAYLGQGATYCGKGSNVLTVDPKMLRDAFRYELSSWMRSNSGFPTSSASTETLGVDIEEE